MAVETTTLVRYYEATVTQPRGDRETQVGDEQWATVRLGEAGAIADHLSGQGQDTQLLRIYVGGKGSYEVPPLPLAATFVSFPWGPPGAGEGWWRDPAAVAKTLGMWRTATPDYSNWPDGAVSFAAQVFVDKNTLSFRVPIEPSAGELSALTDAARARYAADEAAAERFVADLFDARVVPVEESPVAGAAFGSLLSKAPEAAGAVIGSYSVGTDKPVLMLLTMATGMIVFGAASGVASALNAGLRQKILGWMGVPDPLQLPAPSGPAPPTMWDEPSESS